MTYDQVLSQCCSSMFKCHAHQRNLHGLILQNLWIKYGEVKIWRPFVITQMWLWYRKLKSVWKHTIYHGWPIDRNLSDQSFLNQIHWFRRFVLLHLGDISWFQKTSWNIKARGQNIHLVPKIWMPLTLEQLGPLQPWLPLWRLSRPMVDHLLPDYAT